MTNELLHALYGLTPAEARLARALATGDSLQEVAARLGIQITTARTQLATIFDKTDTRRQAKLVALLLIRELAGGNTEALRQRLVAKEG